MAPPEAVPSKSPSVPSAEIIRGDAATSAQSWPLVLVVEDDPDLREALSDLIAQRLGARVLDAADGAEALALAAEERPDLVLTDWSMPRMGGAGLLRALRADPRTRAVPIVLFSGAADRSTAVEMGFDGYLSKPFGLSSLLPLLERLLSVAAPLACSMVVQRAVAVREW